MTLPIQPRRRDVFDDIEIGTNRQQHCDSDESGWRRVARNWSFGKILQNFPQTPERPGINEMEVCARIFLHKLLIIWEDIEVWLLLPFFQSSIEFSRIPCRERNILEQRRFQEIKLRLADHLKDRYNDLDCQTWIKHSIDDKLLLKSEIYRLDASMNGMHNCMSSLAKIKSKAVCKFCRRRVTRRFCKTLESFLIFVHFLQNWTNIFC